MPVRRSALLVATLLAAGVGLTGCIAMPPAPDLPETSPVETSEPVSTTDPIDESDEPVETEESDDAAPAGDVTVPGATLAYGEAATVAWDPGDGEDTEQLISITVDGVRTGTIDELAAAGASEDFLAQMDGYVPFYVDITVTKLEPSTRDLAYTAIYTDFDGLNASGAELSPVSLFGEYAPCDAASFDDTVDAFAPQSVCVVVAGIEGSEVGGAQFASYDSIYDSYDGEPIVWKP